MSTLTSSDIAEVVSQKDVTSKDLRDNFDAIRLAVNDNQTQISNLSSAAGDTEVVNARDEFTTLDERLHITQKLLGSGVITYNRTINSCDATTGWTASTDATATAIDTSTYLEGTGSLKLGKDGTASTNAFYDITPTAANYDGSFIVFDLYIADSTTLADIANAYFDFSPDLTFATNYKRFNLTLVVGWNQITIDCNNPSSTTGTVNDDDSIQAIRIYFATNASGDTISSGKILLDYIRYNGNELKIKAQSTPDMTVQMLAGQAIVNGYGVSNSSSTNSGTLTAPSANPRIDLVTANISGSHYIITGAEAATPVTPDTPYNHIVLAEIYHRVGSTSIQDTDDSTNSYIIDRRKLQVDHPTFLHGTGVPLGSIIAIHPETKAAYLPDAIGDNYAACDGGTTLPAQYFTKVSASVTPDLTDDRFLQGDNTYDDDSSGSNSHTHMIYDSSTDFSWQSDGTTPLTWTFNDAAIGSGSSDFLEYNQNADIYAKSVDSRPKYFSVLYYMRIK